MTVNFVIGKKDFAKNDSKLHWFEPILRGKYGAALGYAAENGHKAQVTYKNEI